MPSPEERQRQRQEQERKVQEQRFQHKFRPWKVQAQTSVAEVRIFAGKPEKVQMKERKPADLTAVEVSTVSGQELVVPPAPIDPMTPPIVETPAEIPSASEPLAEMSAAASTISGVHEGGEVPVKTTHERCGPFSLCRLEPNVSHKVCS